MLVGRSVGWIIIRLVGYIISWSVTCVVGLFVSLLDLLL
jgi:hypothetical protein